MENVLRDIEDTEVYINEVGTFSTDWESHMKPIDEILRRLQENGFPSTH